MAYVQNEHSCDPLIKYVTVHHKTARKSASTCVWFKIHFKPNQHLKGW